MTNIDAFKADIAGIDFRDQGAIVQQKSRDFFWYSPVLRRQLDKACADLIVIPQNEADILRVLAAAYRHDVPVTARGAGTGNFGQSVPLSGGVVLDLSPFDAIIDIRPGAIAVQPGAKPIAVDQAARDQSGQELRVRPTTHRTATMGGFVAGGIGGIGSVRYGTLSDPGNVLKLRIATLEEEPRIIELSGTDVFKAMHTYGTTGVYTELELGLTEAHDWVDVLAGFDRFMAASRFGYDIANDEAIVVNEVAVIAAPFPYDSFIHHQKYIRTGQHVCLVKVAASSFAAFEEAVARHDGEIIFRTDELECTDLSGLPSVDEMVWNHTTLRGIRMDPTVTYLQVLYPAENVLEVIENLLGKMNDEVTTHLEFIRVGGEVTCYAMPVVRYTTDDRLDEINLAYEELGCRVFNPHRYTIEEGGMKATDEAQVAFKRETDPKGLLNPGKMIAWEDPDYAVSSGSMYLFPGLEPRTFDII
ncbi:FAD/FMN-containing dehydrogenase [Rhodobium orientis]|uniref:FAD-linked oxidase n=1 Tax=Rhodobium orientis TaxID=34017 RepID=A0A327JGR2_9HYPH|nr:FAD-binding oxidoreductase [Rhodobium orientis]MBB4304449.1 FAD/FMN-containing dehydrogenase [Rhodobium orientis]MBK5949974.1 FAD-linked oxidase [Rhodobium orientis]RAI25597.1 FAD-linked oxidase [Rhodobium orientis]